MKINSEIKAYFMPKINSTMLAGNRIGGSREKKMDSSASLTISDEGKEIFKCY